MDRRLNADQRPVRLLPKGVHDHGAGIRDLLVREQDDLFSDDLGGDEALRAVCHGILGKVGRPLRQDFQDLL